MHSLKIVRKSNMQNSIETRGNLKSMFSLRIQAFFYQGYRQTHFACLFFYKIERWKNLKFFDEDLGLTSLEKCNVLTIFKWSKNCQERLFFYTNTIFLLILSKIIRWKVLYQVFGKPQFFRLS